MRSKLLETLTSDSFIRNELRGIVTHRHCGRRRQGDARRRDCTEVQYGEHTDRMKEVVSGKRGVLTRRIHPVPDGLYILELLYPLTDCVQLREINFTPLFLFRKRV